MQDGDSGIAVMTGVSNDYVEHEEGCVMAVSLNGLRLVRSRGLLTLGRAVAWGGDSAYDIESLGHPILVDAHVVNLGYMDSVEPLVVSAETLSRCSQSYLEMLCGRLVRVEGVAFAPDLVNEWSYSAEERERWIGTKPFVVEGEEYDSNDDIVLLSYSASYTTFSMMTIPSGRLSLTGIMQCESYSEGGAVKAEIKMRDKYDFL